MKRSMFLMYGVVAYLIFFFTLLYAIGFTGNLFVPKSIDAAQRVSLPFAIAANGFLLILFLVQHAILARPAFKTRWTNLIPPPVERSSFVLLMSSSLLLMMWLWQPIGGVLWSVTGEAGKGFLIFFFFLGWSLVFFSTFLVNHFELFGLSQVWRYYTGKKVEQGSFHTPLLYRFVWHPLYFGLLLAAWCTPVMTVSHLFFAVLSTGYIITAFQYEERGLVTVLGTMMMPFSKKKVS